MIINKKFNVSDKITNISYNKVLFYLDKEMQALVILAGLYEQKIITLDKLKGQLSSLRKGDLLKKKNTYHCSINNRWYSYEPASEILKDLSEYFSEVSYIKLIEVLQLYTTKNYNFCINMIVNSIIKPLLDLFSNSYYSYEYLSHIFNTNIQDFPEIKHLGYYTECYECGSTHFETNYQETKRQIKLVIEFFHLYKKGNLVKIPKYA